MFCSSFTTFISSASSNNTSYPVANIQNIDNIGLHFRNNSTVNCTIMCDLGAVKNISGVFIDDVNFAAMTLIHSTTTAFTASTSATYTIAKDSPFRYKHFCALATSVKALKIVIPTQSPIDGTTYFKIGRVGVISNSTLTLQVNPQFPYRKRYLDFIETNEFPSGGFEDVEVGGKIAMECDFGWNARNTTYGTDIRTLAEWKRNQNLFFFENKSDYSKAYICRRRTILSQSLDDADAESIETITLREVI